MNSLKQRVEKSERLWLEKDPHKIGLEIQSQRLNFDTYLIEICLKIQSLRLNFQSY